MDTPQNIVMGLFFDNRIGYHQPLPNDYLRTELPEIILKLYQQTPNTPLSHSKPKMDRRSIRLIDAFPLLVKNEEFIKGYNRHVENFCTDLKDSDEMEFHGTLIDLSSINSLADCERFFSKLIDKLDSKQDIHPDEKILFKFLLSHLLKIKPETDHISSAHLVKQLTKFFHPDLSHQESDLYSCVLSKGPDLCKLIHHIWNDVRITPKDVEHGHLTRKFDRKSYFVASEVELKKCIEEYLNATLGRNYLGYRMLQHVMPAEILLRERNCKETVLMTAIKYDLGVVLEKLIKITNIDANELTPDGDTHLIHAIKNEKMFCINTLLKVADANTPGLDGKVPLQVAVDCYKKYFEDNDIPFVHNDSINPYLRVIEALAACRGINIDAKDRCGKTALQNMFDNWQPEFLLPATKFLIKSGANIDQPLHNSSHFTIRYILQATLDCNQFAEIETLAKNAVENQNSK